MPYLCSTHMCSANVTDVNLIRHDLGEGSLDEPLQYKQESDGHSGSFLRPY